MDSRNTQQTTEQSDDSPQPENHGTESPSAEQTAADKDSSEPTPQQSPRSEDEAGAGAEEEPRRSPVEMTLDINNFRKAGEKTFTLRSRLFVGNLPLDMTDEEFKHMFAKYGNVSEVFVNRERGFGFIRLVSCEYFLFYPVLARGVRSKRILIKWKRKPLLAAIRFGHLMKTTSRLVHSFLLQMFLFSG